MQRVFLTALVMLGIAACGAPAPQVEKDTKAPAVEPAVVSVPLNVPTPPEVTTEPKPSIIPQDQSKRDVIVLDGYSLIGATMVNQDSRMMARLYDAGAMLKLPDSTVSRANAIVRYLTQLAATKKLAEFQRISHGQRIVDDSTLVDSGVYRMTLKRTTRDSTIENGRFHATWRARTDASRWVILEDVLTPERQATQHKGTK